MRVDTKLQKIYGLRVRMTDWTQQEIIEEVKCLDTELKGEWEQKDIPAGMQIVGLLTSAEQDYCLKRVGFVVSRAIPSRGRAYVKTIAGKDHIDIMDANKKTSLFVGATVWDDELIEKREEAAENRPDP